MNEKTWWSSHIKPRWHRPLEGLVAWKVQDAYNGGLPDVDVCFHGVAAKIELKYAAKYPARPDTVMTFSTLDKVTKTPSIISATQRNHLQQWQQAGGLAYVLIGVGKDWYLFKEGTYPNEGMSRASLLKYSEAHAINQTNYAGLNGVPAHLEAVYGR